MRLRFCDKPTRPLVPGRDDAEKREPTTNQEVLDRFPALDDSRAHPRALQELNRRNQEFWKEANR